MNIVRAVTFVTAFGVTVAGGSLFAFSTFVMPALNRLPADQAVRAMQAINTQAPRSLLMLPLVGSAAGSAALLVYAIARSGAPGRGWLIAGGAIGVAAFMITAAYHVPHNNALAEVDAGGPDAAARWLDYYTGWLRWNHVRTLASLASGAALSTAAFRR